MKVIQVNEKIKIENYPYGRKTTDCYKWYEYKDGKGYRKCYQTVNPQTNKLNAPKKTTYSSNFISRLILDEDTNTYKYIGRGFYDLEKDHDQFFSFMSEYYETFTETELRGITKFILNSYKSQMYCAVVYCGLDQKISIEAHKPTIEILKNILSKDKISNFFKDFTFDYSYKKHYPKDFNPFKVTTHKIEL